MKVCKFTSFARKEERAPLQYAKQKCLSAFVYRKFTHFTHVKLHMWSSVWSFHFFCYVSLSDASLSLSFSLSLSLSRTLRYISITLIHSHLPTHTLGLGQDFELFRNSLAHHGKQIYSFVAFEITLELQKNAAFISASNALDFLNMLLQVLVYFIRISMHHGR